MTTPILWKLAMMGVNTDDTVEVGCFINTLALTDKQKAELMDMYEKESGKAVIDTQKQEK